MNVCNYKHPQRYHADYPGCHNNRNIELINDEPRDYNIKSTGVSTIVIPELLRGKDLINKRSYSRSQIS